MDHVTLPVLSHDEALEIRRGDWMRDAVCTNNPGAFEATSTNTPLAKLICAQCPVETPCLHYGVLTVDLHHILGRTTPAERRRLDNGQRVSTCSNCYCDFPWRKLRSGQSTTMCARCAGADPADPIYTDPEKEP